MNHYKRVGDEKGAICLKQNPLHCCKTLACIQFDQKNKMTIEVRFKIYTPTTVDINLPSQTPDKVGAGKKPAKSIKLNLLNSKKMKGKYLEIKACLFGKSLNKFKTIVADACEAFQAGMRSIVLNRDFSPELKWKTTVRRLKQVLDLVDQWQAFVTALEKSRVRQGLVVIKNDNVEVQSMEETTDSATRQLIAQTNGEGTNSRDSKYQFADVIFDSRGSNKDADLHIMANKIFSQEGISGYAGSEGTILSLPWNPAFRYQMTYAAAWIWAKAVIAGIATEYLPPNTREFNQEVKKSEWTHPDMGVDNRVQMRLQGHPRKLQPVMGGSTSSSNATGSTDSSTHINSKAHMKELKRKSFSQLTEPEESKPDIKELKPKTIIDLTDSDDSKPDLKKVFNDPDSIKSKPEVKKIKIEDHFGSSIEHPITVSSDTEIDRMDTRTEDSETDGIGYKDSKVDAIKVDASESGLSESEPDNSNSNYSITMELFLAECEIPKDDYQTRNVLKDLGIISWTDLIPSVQMTALTLISKGIDRQIASCLVDEAKARYNSISQNLQVWKFKN
ncbi:hypothetical protein DFH28DRAFT_925274 [Melampsora americana]|nr:hypothetical protein DFH28DRAFT_925274 [Melampsora americana]